MTTDSNDATGGSPDEGLKCIMKLRLKLLRFRDSQWKERGVGQCRLLRDGATKRIHLTMRQEKTKKPIANFMIAESPLCDLMPSP